MAVDHTLFKVRLNAQKQPDFEHVSPFNRTDHWYLDETGKLAVVREVTYARVFVRRTESGDPRLALLLLVHHRNKMESGNLERDTEITGHSRYSGPMRWKPEWEWAG